MARTPPSPPEPPPLPAEARRLGVYVHYPYCSARCPYCDFTVTTRALDDDRYRDAVIAELRARARDFTERPPAVSVYFGGGTPGLWDPAALGAVIDAVADTVGLAADAEITVEANPGEVTAAHALGWRAAGVNRISLGVQSFADQHLAFLGRAHRAADVHAAIAALRRVGLGEISVDLIHGMAGQTVAEAVGDAAAALATGAPHVSTYQLTIEARTRFGLWARRGQTLLAEDGLLAEMYAAVQATLEAGGVRFYEISNAARPGHEAVHNGLYWSFAEYLGLGAGAHGFRRGRGGGARWANGKHPQRYMEGALAGRLLQEVEAVDAATLAEERVLTGLRRWAGLPVDADLRVRFGGGAAAAVARGWLTDDGDRWRATPAGRAVLDRVVLEVVAAR
ncbi:MAG: radical SAM family heme chaperone HemW [Myxococcales bacterium]|nr:radical SAM family heme chaperone HemW [Myxococcales bacterium]